VIHGEALPCGLLAADLSDLAPHALVTVVALAVLALTAIVHVSFAVAIYHDAMRRATRLVFVGPQVWTIAALLGGVLTAVTYWVVHYSTLSQSDEPRASG
jgi:hypothetical protein